MNRATRLSIPLLCLFAWAPAWAQDVELTSRDGSVQVTGTLLDFDGAFFRVQTAYGPMSIDAAGVTCTGTACPAQPVATAEIRIAGARAMGEVLMPALLEAFARDRGYVMRREIQGPSAFSYVLSGGAQNLDIGRFVFEVSDTAQGFATFGDGAAEIMLALRPPTDEELTTLVDAGVGNIADPSRNMVVARDALVPVVNPENPVRSVSLEDLAKILAGEITNWTELGGADLPIALHLRDPESGLMRNLDSRVMDPFDRTATDEQVVRYGSNADLVDALIRDPFGIGVTSFSELGNAQPLSIVGGCGFEAHASRAAIKTGDYPLTMPLFLYWPEGRLPGLAAEFLDFARGTTAQPVIRLTGFVDHGAERMKMSAQGDRLLNAISLAGIQIPVSELRRMAADLGDKTQLSLSFRFEAGSTTDLDAASRNAIQRLAEALEAGTYDGHTVTIVGFADGIGSSSQTLRVGRTRARAVEDALRAAAPDLDETRVTLEREAFGETSPLACDDTDAGRQVNRRVEIWID